LPSDRPVESAVETGSSAAERKAPRRATATAVYAGFPAAHVAVTALAEALQDPTVSSACMPRRQKLANTQPLLAKHIHSIVRLGSVGDDGSGIELGQSAGGVVRLLPSATGGFRGDRPATSIVASQDAP